MPSTYVNVCVTCPPFDFNRPDKSIVRFSSFNKDALPLAFLLRVGSSRQCLDQEEGEVTDPKVPSLHTESLSAFFSELERPNQ